MIKRERRKDAIPPVIAFLCAAAVLAGAGCATAGATGGPLVPERLRDGMYEGSARSWPNSAKVRIAVSDGRITRIDLLSHFSSRIGRRAERDVPSRIIERQSTSVDAVTGATNSSRVIMNAVQNAVEKASCP